MSSSGRNGPTSSRKRSCPVEKDASLIKNSNKVSAQNDSLKMPLNPSSIRSAGASRRVKNGQADVFQSDSNDLQSPFDAVLAAASLAASDGCTFCPSQIASHSSSETGKNSIPLLFPPNLDQNKNGNVNQMHSLSKSQLTASILLKANESSKQTLRALTESFFPTDLGHHEFGNNNKEMDVAFKDANTNLNDDSRATTTTTTTTTPFKDYASNLKQSNSNLLKAGFVGKNMNFASNANLNDEKTHHSLKTFIESGNSSESALADSILFGKPEYLPSKSQHVSTLSCSLQKIHHSSNSSTATDPLVFEQCTESLTENLSKDYVQDENSPVLDSSNILKFNSNSNKTNHDISLVQQPDFNESILAHQSFVSSKSQRLTKNSLAPKDSEDLTNPITFDLEAFSKRDSSDAILMSDTTMPNLDSKATISKQEPGQSYSKQDALDASLLSANQQQLHQSQSQSSKQTFQSHQQSNILSSNRPLPKRIAPSSNSNTILPSVFPLPVYSDGKGGREPCSNILPQLNTQSSLHNLHLNNHAVSNPSSFVSQFASHSAISHSPAPFVCSNDALCDSNNGTLVPPSSSNVSTNLNYTNRPQSQSQNIQQNSTQHLPPKQQLKNILAQAKISTPQRPSAPNPLGLRPSLSGPVNSGTSGSQVDQTFVPNSLKTDKGLRHFSSLVCAKVEEKGSTTYNEVADELVLELGKDALLSRDLPKRVCDQKNIRRRVYDALNVLMALDIIRKDKKDIRWLGIPNEAAAEAEQLRSAIKSSAERLSVKRKSVVELVQRLAALKSLISRNNMMEDADRANGGNERNASLRNSTTQCHGTNQSNGERNENFRLDEEFSKNRGEWDDMAAGGEGASAGNMDSQSNSYPSAKDVSDRLQLPFILINAPRDCRVHCEMLEDRTQYYFDFDSPFLINEDIELLRLMGLGLQDDSDCFSEHHESNHLSNILNQSNTNNHPNQLANALVKCTTALQITLCNYNESRGGNNSSTVFEEAASNYKSFSQPNDLSWLPMETRDFYKAAIYSCREWGGAVGDGTRGNVCLDQSFSQSSNANGQNAIAHINTSIKTFDNTRNNEMVMANTNTNTNSIYSINYNTNNSINNNGNAGNYANNNVNINSAPANIYQNDQNEMVFSGNPLLFGGISFTQSHHHQHQHHNLNHNLHLQQQQHNLQQQQHQQHRQQHQSYQNQFQNLPITNDDSQETNFTLDWRHGTGMAVSQSQEQPLPSHQSFQMDNTLDSIKSQSMNMNNHPSLQPFQSPPVQSPLKLPSFLASTAFPIHSTAAHPSRPFSPDHSAHCLSIPTASQDLVDRNSTAPHSKPSSIAISNAYTVKSSISVNSDLNGPSHPCRRGSTSDMKRNISNSNATTNAFTSPTIFSHPDAHFYSDHLSPSLVGDRFIDRFDPDDLIFSDRYLESMAPSYGGMVAVAADQQADQDTRAPINKSHLNHC